MLEVRARTARVRHRLRHVLGGAGEGLTAGSISANWRGRRFTAQPPTYTSRAPLFSERRTDWRDFASASPVMQQVLITCSSASSSGTSSWPASSSWRRASIASAWETLQPRNFTAKRMPGRVARSRPALQACRLCRVCDGARHGDGSRPSDDSLLENKAGFERAAGRAACCNALKAPPLIGREVGGKGARQP